MELYGHKLDNIPLHQIDPVNWKGNQQQSQWEKVEKPVHKNAMQTKDIKE